MQGSILASILASDSDRQESKWCHSQTLAWILGIPLMVLWHLWHVNKDFTESYALNIEIVTKRFSKPVIIIIYLQLLFFLTGRNIPSRLFLFLIWILPKGEK